MSTIEEFRSKLDGDTLAMIDRLRAIVAASDSQLAEHVKWNAPSFTLGGVDLITLGLEREGGVRLVLHRGAKAEDTRGFSFDDPEKLATWPAPDRGVMAWRSLAQIDRVADPLTSLCRRWIARAG